ncbi:hypothetical protein B0H17DRAFT_1130672 [Mycena rosella]|uniref:Uncharacterized protein n=1 Tax=Mycena rosella TaxID=1033263 RepID=A0AAD7DT27_MYCRO|nr:hypothetical protein B0H17DRAFT_1130672 [Mycena rosella]
MLGVAVVSILMIKTNRASRPRNADNLANYPGLDRFGNHSPNYPKLEARRSQTRGGFVDVYSDSDVQRQPRVFERGEFLVCFFGLLVAYSWPSWPCGVGVLRDVSGVFDPCGAESSRGAVRACSRGRRPRGVVVVGGSGGVVSSARRVVGAAARPTACDGGVRVVGPGVLIRREALWRAWRGGGLGVPWATAGVEWRGGGRWGGVRVRVAGGVGASGPCHGALSRYGARTQRAAEAVRIFLRVPVPQRRLSRRRPSRRALTYVSIQTTYAPADNKSLLPSTGVK